MNTLCNGNMGVSLHVPLYYPDKQLSDCGATAIDTPQFYGLPTVQPWSCCSGYLVISYSWLPATGNLLGWPHCLVS
jgi:hypothetical protein